MIQTIKCKQCKKEVEKSQAIKIADRSYCCCKECAEIYSSKKNSNKKNYKSVKGSIREQCTDYIQSLYIEQGYNKKSINWGLIGSQLSNMLKDNPTWKYSTIKYCLWYMKEIKEMNLFDASQGSILNLVPFYIDEAKEYYFNCMNIEQAISDFDFEENTIVVKKGIDKCNKKWYNEIKVDEI